MIVRGPRIVVLVMFRHMHLHLKARSFANSLSHSLYRPDYLGAEAEKAARESNALAHASEAKEVITCSDCAWNSNLVNDIEPHPASRSMPIAS